MNMFNDIENPPEDLGEGQGKKQKAAESTVIQSEVFGLEPTNPNWRENFREAVIREFSDRFSPYDLSSQKAAREYYEKHRHYF